MTLSEIERQIEELLFMQQEHELSDDDIRDTLDALLLDRNDKIDNIAIYIKHLKAMAIGTKEIEREYAARRQSYENKAERLIKYLSYFLDGDKYESPKTKITWKKSEQVVVDDIDKLGKQFMRVKETVEPDKGLIKEVIKTGAEVEGAHLEIKNNISVK